MWVKSHFGKDNLTLIKIFIGLVIIADRLIRIVLIFQNKQEK